MSKTTWLRSLGGSVYETLDGRYRIERQDGETECEHPLCDTLHRRFHVYHGRSGDWSHPVSYVSWHVWDTVHDDYADGCNEEFDSKRDAAQWLWSHLEREKRNEQQDN